MDRDRRSPASRAAADASAHQAHVANNCRVGGAGPSRRGGGGAGVFGLFVWLLVLIPCDLVIVEGQSVSLWLERKPALDVPIRVIESPRGLGALAVLGAFRGEYRGCVIGVGKGGVSFMEFD